MSKGWIFFKQEAKLLFRQCWAFLLPTGLFAFFGAIVLSQIQRGHEVLLVNGWHQPAADFFFRYATWLGDGMFWLVIFALIIARQQRFGVLAAIAGLLSAMIVQGLKNIFRMERPIRVLAEYDLALVEGVRVYGFMSFPSGHTGAAFTGFFLLAAWSGKPAIGIVCFLLAALAGFSRIYLAQHFLMDVYAGALLGTTTGFIILALFRNRGWFAGGAKE